ncbi:MAG: DUF4270 domain-containing protein [Bacteroidota bacterium]
MKSYLTKLPASLLIGFLLILATFSCKKDPYEIGFDLLPPSDTLNVKTTDTCTVEAFSMIQDSVRTDKVTVLTFGSIMDPIFGQTTAGFYTQVMLSSEAIDFGTKPVLDSLVLMLFYSSYYGDTLTRQNVKVYEISDAFSYDSLHFSNQRLATYPTVLADQDFTPRVSDSVVVYTDTLAPHLRINLSKQTNYLGEKILNAPADALATNAAFVKFVRGLYVTASPVNNKGAMLNFKVTGGVSKLVVYFHDGTDPAHDSLHYDMVINEISARFIHTDHHGYLDASPDLKQQILNHDSTLGTNKLFLQGMGGVKVKLKFPFIKNLGKGKIIAVNDAILELKNMQNDTTLPAPVSLALIRQDSIGRIGYLVDESEGSGYFGGTYNTTTHSYFFRLTQHMQNVIMNSYANHFDLYMMVNSPVTSLATPNRIMLNGTKPQIPGDYGNRFQLKMTYTILN